MNILSDEKRLRVFAALVDGNSIRAIERMTDVHQRTIRRFALKLGEGAERFHNARVKDLCCSLVEMDEIWGYVHKKQARVLPGDPPEFGEQYTFVALDANARLAISWCVGKRTQETCDLFAADLRARLLVMPQITSDGFVPYVTAVGDQFGKAADFSQVVKNYRGGKVKDDDRRYEPARGIDFLSKKVVFGAPDMSLSTTAHVERLNGTTRHFVGRLRRLTYAFSKTLAGLKAAMALHYTHYNFCHVLRTLRVTPALQMGLTDHVWELGEMMEALLSAPPVARPEKRPLTHRTPVAPARPLPNGRGFLRLVGGGGEASASPAPDPSPAPPVALVPAPVASVAAGLSFDENGQADLFTWTAPKREPVQLGLFGDDDRGQS